MKPTVQVRSWGKVEDPPHPLKRRRFAGKCLPSFLSFNKVVCYEFFVLFFFRAFCDMFKEENSSLSNESSDPNTGNISDLKFGGLTSVSKKLNKEGHHPSPQKKAAA